MLGGQDRRASATGRRAEPAYGPGAHPPGTPWRPPHTQMARCATARMRSARRLGRRETARAGRPSAAVRLRQSTSTSTAWSARCFAGSAKRRVQWSYGAVVTSLSGVRGGREGAGEHPLGGGVVDDGPRQGRDGDRDVLLQGAVGPGRRARRPASSAIRCGTRRVRECGSRGDRARGRGRRRRGPAPQGLWWRVVSASVQTAPRRRLLHAHRKQAALRLPDSIATAAWPASTASVSRVG